MTTPVHVELRGVTKRFGATVALDAVDLRIERGRVHALVGENGAGKSTVGKIVAGVHGVDEGSLVVDGEEVDLRSPRQALAHGITIVAQELSLVPARTVEENVFLGLEPHRGPLVSRRALRRCFEELVHRTGIEVEADAVVGRLSVAEQQRVEILRSLAREAELIVMDEPTARLTAREAEDLGRTIRALAGAGTTVVLVSHFLAEVLALADTVTVMRDGRVVRTGPSAEETEPRLIEAMIGRRLEASFPDRTPPPAEAPEVLRIEGLSGRTGVEEVDLTVRAGEIVVLTGLVGAGRTELVRMVYGADRRTAGTVLLDGRPLDARHPVEAIRRGVAMIPEARRAQGLLPTRSVRENITLPHLRSLSAGGVVRRRREARAAADATARTGVRAASAEAAVSSLSGGNQQKVLFARSLLVTPRLLIADEPTRGIDVGAKRAVYDLIAEQAAAGMGVLVVTSEMEEVLGLAHRVVVMREGRAVAELEGTAITQHAVAAAAFGATPDPDPKVTT